MEEDDELADGVMYACPTCEHPDWWHPEMAPPEGGRSRCAECNADLGPWEELKAKLFVGGAMLSQALARKP